MMILQWSVLPTNEILNFISEVTNQKRKTKTISYASTSKYKQWASFCYLVLILENLREKLFFTTCHSCIVTCPTTNMTYAADSFLTNNLNLRWKSTSKRFVFFSFWLQSRFNCPSVVLTELGILSDIDTLKIFDSGWIILL